MERSNRELGEDRGFSPLRGRQNESASNPKDFQSPRSDDSSPRRPFSDRPQGEFQRKSFGDTPSDRGGFNSDRPRRFEGDRQDRSFSPRSDRPQNREASSFGERRPSDRPFTPRSEGNGFNGERRPFSDRPQGEFQRKSFGDDRSDRGAFQSDRPRRSDSDRQDRPFSPRGEGSNFGSERRPFSDRPQGPRHEGSERRPFSDRQNSRHEGDDRRSFSDRHQSQARFGDRPFAPRGRAQEELPPALRKVEALKTDKGREREGFFLAEGVRCVAEIVQNSPEVIEKVYFVEGLNESALLGEIDKKKIRKESLAPNLFYALSSTETSQGILAVVRPAPIKPNWETAQIVTIVDGVQDPGNLGSIFRSCLGFGVDALILGKGTCDPFNPKVVRGSSGTFLRVPFETHCNLHERILFLLTKGFSVVATSPHALQTISDIKLHKKVAFLIGNEGSGASAQLIDMCTDQVRIPMNSGLESLNVAVAHGVLAYELSRLRV